METELTPEKAVHRQWYHEELPLCLTRAKYRQGRQFTAVKVYTVLDESSHLLIDNVTCVDVRAELLALCRRFGRVAAFHRVTGYQIERFTSTFHVQYCRVAAARFAKRGLDNRNFYGTHLKVCYAPELEDPRETADKLAWRQASYSRTLRRNVTLEAAGDKKSGGSARDRPRATGRPCGGTTSEGAACQLSEADSRQPGSHTPAQEQDTTPNYPLIGPQLPSILQSSPNLQVPDRREDVRMCQKRKHPEHSTDDEPANTNLTTAKRILFHKRSS